MSRVGDRWPDASISCRGDVRRGPGGSADSNEARLLDSCARSTSCCVAPASSTPSCQPATRRLQQDTIFQWQAVTAAAARAAAVNQMPPASSSRTCCNLGKGDARQRGNALSEFPPMPFAAASSSAHATLLTAAGQAARIVSHRDAVVVLARRGGTASSAREVCSPGGPCRQQRPRLIQLDEMDPRPQLRCRLRVGSNRTTRSRRRARTAAPRTACLYKAGHVHPPLMAIKGVRMGPYRVSAVRGAPLACSLAEVGAAGARAHARPPARRRPLLPTAAGTPKQASFRLHALTVGCALQGPRGAACCYPRTARTLESTGSGPNAWAIRKRWQRRAPWSG
jgi:hypothetical protein